MKKSSRELFFEKYTDYFTDVSCDGRGVFGEMDKRAAIPYDEFENDVPDVPILVYYYHPEKPYFWGKPSNFPYTDINGPAPENKPWIIKRSLAWYPVPEKVKIFEPLCFTMLKWEFEITMMFFSQLPIIIEISNNSQGQYNLDEINKLFDTYR